MGAFRRAASLVHAQVQGSSNNNIPSALTEERAPVPRGGACTNAARRHWRGLLSALLAVVFFAALLDTGKKESKSNVIAIWLTMAAFMLIAPMSASACALIPLFSLPMTGVLATDDCCAALMNEHMILLYLGGWLMLLANNCGLDRRLACCFLASGGKGAYTPNKLLLKACMAAFCISAIAEREITTQIVMQYIISALEPLKNVENEADYDALSKIICNAVAVSSMLGSMCFVHASLNVIQLRSTFSEVEKADAEYPDVFNFLNYSAYAVPTALLMFVLNTLYTSLLISRTAGKNLPSDRSIDALKRVFAKNQNDIGPMTKHEKVSVMFLVALFVMFFSRWSTWMKGWGATRQVDGVDVCDVTDATTAAMFVVLLHWLPKSLHFTKIWTVKRHGDLPKMKPESGILYWKFVDKHIDYSLFLLIGAGSVIYKAAMKTGVNHELPGAVTGLGWHAGTLLVVLAAVVLGSVMPPMAAQSCLMPLMLAMAMQGPDTWPGRRPLVALAVGLGTALGFCRPMPHTPSAHVRTTARVEAKKQIFYSIASSVICGVVLWLSICFYATALYEPVKTPGSGGGGGGDGGGSDAPTTPPPAP